MNITINARSVWREVLHGLTVFLICGAACYVSYVEGYRRGCMDTIKVVEEKADAIVKRLVGG